MIDAPDRLSWIGVVTIDHTPRMRCSACGQRGHVIEIRKGGELGGGWSSSN